MDTLFGIFIKILILMALGFFLRRIHILTEELQEGLSNLLIKVILPISVLASSNGSYSPELATNMGLVAVIAASYYMVALCLVAFVSRKLRLSPGGKKIFQTMAVFANTGFIGIPIMTELYGSRGGLYAVVYNLFYQLLFFTYGIYLLSGAKKFELKSVFLTPVTMASVLSVLIFLSPFRFPSSIQDTFLSIGSMMVPISMMIIGSTISTMKLSVIIKDGYSYLVSAFRMIIFPLLVLLVTRLLKLPEEVTCVCTLMTALPSGSLNVILAQRYHCEEQYAARTVVQSMVLSVFAIPLYIMLLQL